MLLRDTIKVRLLLRDSRWFIYVVLAWTALVIVLDELLPVDLIANPSPPVTMLGIAVAFFIGFKTSSAYDRWWEARKIWGAIVNASRDWGATVGNLVDRNGAPIPEQDRRALIERHIAWINMLAFQMRQPSPFGPNRRRWMFGYQKLHDEPKAHLTDEAWQVHQLPQDLPAIEGKTNRAATLLYLQTQHLSKLASQGLIDPYWHTALVDKLARFADAQGASERIKNTPFPRQAVEIGSICVWIFIILMPLAFHDQRLFEGMWAGSVWIEAELHWLTLAPIDVLICWVFLATERLSSTMEDPFEGEVTDVAISAICRTVEIDLRQMTGWGTVPPPAQAIGPALY